MEILYNLIALLPVAVLAPAFWIARRLGAGQRSLLLLMLPIPYALCMGWGLAFSVPAGDLRGKESLWVADILGVFILMSVVLSLGVVWALRKARVVAAVVGLIEVISTFAMAFMAVMMVTGNWI